jgi:xylulokinase
VWWHDFVQITRALHVKTSVEPRAIRGIGVSGVGPCVLPVDVAGQPLRPGILYGIDTRADEEIGLLESALGREEIFRRTGMQLSSQESGPKVLWIRNHEPDVFRRARWFLTSQAYQVYKLTDLASIDVYTVGYYSPLYDVFQQAWIPEAADLIVPVDRLPQVYWSSDVVGSVTAAAARETGLAEGTPVVAGTADAAAEAFIAGMVSFGELFLMFGSSIFFYFENQ